MTDIKAVEIEGTIKRLRTMADGSIDLTINLSETCKAAAGQMIAGDWVNQFVQGVIEVLRKDEEAGNKSGLYGIGN